VAGKSTQGTTSVARTPVIACVDDDESICKAIKGLLQASGFEVETFSSAEDFLQSDWLHDASCLITDVKLSGMSGLQLLDHLASSGNRIPVIVITAFPDERMRARVLGAGAVGFLGKPVGKGCLLTCVSSALDRHHGGKEQG
jgi:FixJ family two-component response regulator